MAGHSEEKDDKKQKRSSGKLTDKQKSDLKKHMEKHKDELSPSEFKSHRMKMMSRMRKGMSIKKAHEDIMKK
jgi:hypothetical protein